MSDLPAELQRARAAAYARQRQQGQEPAPFPGRIGPQRDWERGTTMGGSVRLPTGPAPQRPQGQRPSLMSQYANVVPWEGLGDLGGFVGEQTMRAPGRLMRGEPTNAMPPPPAPSVTSRPMGEIEPPSQYGDGAPPPFPLVSRSAPMRRGASLSEVYSPGGSDGMTGSAPPQPLPGRPGRGPGAAEYEIDPEWLAANPSPTVSATYGDHIRPRGNIMERNRPLRPGEEPQNTYPPVPQAPEYARRPARERALAELEQEAWDAAWARRQMAGPLPPANVYQDANAITEREQAPGAIIGGSLRLPRRR